MTEDPELLRLSDVARELDMSLPNVRRFLKRRGVLPVDDRPRHARWDPAVIAAVKADRAKHALEVERDQKRRASYERARRSKKRSVDLAQRELGKTQRRLLDRLYENGAGPIQPASLAERSAMKRLAARGLATHRKVGYAQTALGRLTYRAMISSSGYNPGKEPRTHDKEQTRNGSSKTRARNR